MGVALFTTGPYIDMAISGKNIMTPTIEDGVVTWRVPLGVFVSEAPKAHS
jgi:hypothetical protein